MGLCGFCLFNLEIFQKRVATDAQIEKREKEKSNIEKFRI